MALRHIIGFLLLLAAGCAVISPAPAPVAMQGGTVVVERLPPAAPDQSPRSINIPGGSVIIERLPPLPEVMPELPVAVVAPIAPAAAPPKTTTAPPVAAASAAPAANVAAKVPPKAAAPAVREPQLQKPAAAPARAAAATLDLDALEQRLKNTEAIGVFTKIALKNQVDDLLKRFKAHHESDGKTALAQLRQSYDQLLLKVNDLLKNGDPALAGEIMGSREAIWGVLSDPVKFAKL